MLFDDDDDEVAVAVVAVEFEPFDESVVFNDDGTVELEYDDELLLLLPPFDPFLTLLVFKLRLLLQPDVSPPLPQPTPLPFEDNDDTDDDDDCDKSDEDDCLLLSVLLKLLLLLTLIKSIVRTVGAIHA